VRVLALNGALLAVLVLAVGLLQLGSRSDVAVENVVRRYAAAVGARDLDAALDEIAPDSREAYREWVESQLGSEYEVRGIAVHAPSLLGRAGRQPFEVAAVMDVNRRFPGEFFSATPRVPVEQVAGRWYLSKPLLAE
jgi:hypothetical protein